MRMTLGIMALMAALSLPQVAFASGVEVLRFFGFGNESEDNEWQFPRETALLSATVGRSFTEGFIGDFAVSYRHVNAATNS